MGLRPAADLDVRLQNVAFLPSGDGLRVEGENALVVATHQEHRGQVFGQHLQPGHVERAGHSTLPGQWQAPGQRTQQKTEDMCELELSHKQAYKRLVLGGGARDLTPPFVLDRVGLIRNWCCSFVSLRLSE